MIFSKVFLGGMIEVNEKERCIQIQIYKFHVLDFTEIFMSAVDINGYDNLFMIFVQTTVIRNC